MKCIYTLLLCLLSLQGNQSFAQIADKELLSLIGGSIGKNVETGVIRILCDSVRSHIYVLVNTSDKSLPVTEDAYLDGDSIGGYYNSYLAIYDMEMRELLYGSYLGGSRGATASEMIWSDYPNEILIAGSTESSDFPTTENARQKRLSGYSDVWYARYSLSDRRFTYVSFLGGRDHDYCDAAYIDSSGRLLLAGSTNSIDFTLLRTPVTKPWTDGYGDAALFVLKGDSLEYAVALGGDSYDEIEYVFEVEDSYILVGHTRSANYPTTPGSLQRDYGDGGDATVTEISKDFTSLRYSTMLGGEGTEWVMNARQFGSRIHVVGETTGGVGYFPMNYPAIGFDTLALYNGFHVIYDAEQDSIVYSSLIIGNGGELVFDVCIADERSYILLVHAESDSLINIANPYPEQYNKSMDVLVLVDLFEYNLLRVQLLSAGTRRDGISKIWPTPFGLYFSGYTAIPVPVRQGGHRTTYLGGTEAFIGKLHLNINAQEALRPPVASLLSLSPFPNPARAAATALLTAAPGAYTLRIHGSDGRELRSQRVYFDGGGGSVSVPLDDLAAGHYQLSAVDAQGRIVARSALVVEGR